MNPYGRPARPDEPCSSRPLQPWKVPEDECRAEWEPSSMRKAGRSLTYGKLCEKAAKLQVPKDPPLKKEAEFRYIGKPMPGLDIPAKVSGKAVFGLDVDLPGPALCRDRPAPGLSGPSRFPLMKRPPEQVKGVVKVVPDPPGSRRLRQDPSMRPGKDGRPSR